MTLRSLAQELCEPHLTSIGGRIGRVPGLLTELREAVSGSSTGDAGGGASSKAKILVNATALDLLNNIDNEVRTAYTDRYGNVAPTLETSVDLIGKGEHPAEWDAWFTERFKARKAEIEALLRPKKMRRLDGVQCPSCGQATFGEERATCLYLDCYTNQHKELKHITDWIVSCQSCSASWGHGDMKWLLVALGS